jgi:hypothetical protein
MSCHAQNLLSQRKTMIFVRLWLCASIPVTFWVVAPPALTQCAAREDILLVPPPEGSGTVGDLGAPELSPGGLGAALGAKR